MPNRTNITKKDVHTPGFVFACKRDTIIVTKKERKILSKETIVFLSALREDHLINKRSEVPLEEIAVECDMSFKRLIACMNQLIDTGLFKVTYPNDDVFFNQVH